MNLGDTDTEQCKTKVNIYFPTDIFLLRLKKTGDAKLYHILQDNQANR